VLTVLLKLSLYQASKGVPTTAMKEGCWCLNP
jgi:hypothetical protein